MLVPARRDCESCAWSLLLRNLLLLYECFWNVPTESSHWTRCGSWIPRWKAYLEIWMPWYLERYLRGIWNRYLERFHWSNFLLISWGHSEHFLEASITGKLLRKPQLLRIQLISQWLARKDIKKNTVNHLCSKCYVCWSMSVIISS